MQAFITFPSSSIRHTHYILHGARQQCNTKSYIRNLFFRFNTACHRCNGARRICFIVLNQSSERIRTLLTHIHRRHATATNNFKAGKAKESLPTQTEPQILTKAFA